MNFFIAYLFVFSSQYQIWTASRKLKVSCMLYLNKQAPITWFLTSCCISLLHSIFLWKSHINAAGKYSPWQNMKCSAEFTEFMHEANISERIFTCWPSAVKYTEFWFWRPRILLFQKEVWTFDKKCTHFPKALLSFPPKEPPLFSVWNVSAELNCLLRKLFAAWIKQRMH